MAKMLANCHQALYRARLNGRHRRRAAARSTSKRPSPGVSSRHRDRPGLYGGLDRERHPGDRPAGGLRDRGLEVTRPGWWSLTAPRRCRRRCGRCSTTRYGPLSTAQNPQRGLQIARFQCCQYDGPTLCVLQPPLLAVATGTPFRSVTRRGPAASSGGDLADQGYLSMLRSAHPHSDCLCSIEGVYWPWPGGAWLPCSSTSSRWTCATTMP